MRLILSVVLYTALGLGANPAAADLAVVDALRLGDMQKLVLDPSSPEVPDVPFLDEDGAEISLEDFSGKIVLANFWATWCAPCREEMPSLQKLEDRIGGDQFAVVTIATGRNAPEAIERFFAQAGVTTLPRYRDPKQDLARNASILGLPVTLLIDRKGHEIGRLTGGADWSSPEAEALLRAVIAQ